MGEWAGSLQQGVGQDAKVILHTDGAKSYKLKGTGLSGVVHDWVVHKKKCQIIKGKRTWLKPKYVLLTEHHMPEGKILRVKAGTQIIDRAWHFIKNHVGKRTGQIGHASFKHRVRSAQWLYWHRREDQWAATGKMLASLSA